MDSPPAGAAIIRPLAAEHLPAILELAREQGRNVAPDEYERFVSLEGARGLVVFQGEELVGVATALRYYDHGLLGPVVLRAGPDSVGLAIALTAQLIERLQKEELGTVESEAAPDEEAILSRMGFQRLRQTLVMERPGPAPSDPPTTRPMEPADLLDIGLIDTDAVGFGRKDLIMALQSAMPQAARVVTTDDEVTGFVLLRPAARGYHLGPLVTRSSDDGSARRLLADALAGGAGDGPVTALVPDEPRARELFTSAGFEVVAMLSRMRGGADLPERAGATEWAVGGRLTG